jgi:hypothetical protein
MYLKVSLRIRVACTLCECWVNKRTTYDNKLLPALEVVVAAAVGQVIVMVVDVPILASKPNTNLRLLVLRQAEHLGAHNLTEGRSCFGIEISEKIGTWFATNPDEIGTSQLIFLWQPSVGMGRKVGTGTNKEIHVVIGQ